MARIRHIAIYTESPDAEAAFYCKAFDLKEVKRSPSGAQRANRVFSKCESSMFEGQESTSERSENLKQDERRHDP
jgi:catechol 2,3-dioxygenase-like lactoylglutathione lyase family enzyme